MNISHYTFSILMAEALYRKYRPTTFREVAEQGHVVRTISNQLAQGKVAHAYLFAGPRGVGKTTIARLLAKALNCERRDPGESEPCNQCQSCLDMMSGRMMDVVEIDAASQTKVEETRENIIENVRFGPTRGKYKVFIIDEVHMLSTASFNALLKTLEEPPAHGVFILATTELHKIPATIISRCQRFDFHRIPAKEMIERLARISKEEGVTVDETVLASIVKLSEGCLRDAESLLGQLFALGESAVTVETASLILPATHLDVVASLAEAVNVQNVQNALSIVTEFVEHGGSVRHLVDELIEYVRSLMFAALGSVPADAYDPAALARLTATAKLSTPDQHRHFLDLLLAARSRQSLSALPQIPLEIAVVAVCGETAPVLTPTLSEALPAGRQGEGATPPPPPMREYDDLPPSVLTPSVSPVSGGATPSNGATAPLNGGITAPGTVPPPVKEGSGEVLPFSLLDFQEKWGRVCSYLAEKNVTLPLVLKSAKPLKVDGGKVAIGFEYQFHVNAMQEQKNLRLLSEAIGVIMMAVPGEIELVLTKSSEEQSPVDVLVEAFGGEIV